VPPSYEEGYYSADREWDDLVIKPEQNPNWKSDIANHVQAGTPLTVQAIVVEPLTIFGQGSVRHLIQDMGESPDLYGISTSGTTQSMDPFHGVTTTYPSDVTADNQAKTAFVKHALERQRTFQGGVFLGELTEAVGILSSPLKSFRRSLDKYIHRTRRRVKRLKPRDRQGFVGDTWLEYHFGWLPLLNDIDDAAHTLAEVSAKISRHSPFEVVAGYGRAQVNYTHPSYVNLAAGGTYYSIKGRRSVENKTEIKYVGEVRIEQVPKFSSQRLGLGLRDAIPTAWELIPYSFLVDYFTNVGDYFQALAYGRCGATWVLKYTERTSTQSWSGIVNDPPVNEDRLSSSGTGTQGKYQTRVLSRGPYLEGFVPSLEFSILGPKTGQWLNVAGLSLAKLRF
jgi:hypothetical protein